MTVKIESDRSNEDGEDEDDDDEDECGESVQRYSKQREKPPDVRLESYVIQDQRILDSDDDVIRFDDRPVQDNTTTANIDTTQIPAKGAEGGRKGGGWKFQNPNRVRQRVKRIIRRELSSEDMMSAEEASEVS